MHGGIVHIILLIEVRAMTRGEMIRATALEAGQLTLDLLLGSAIISTTRTKKISCGDEKRGEARLYCHVTFQLENGWKVVAIPISVEQDEEGSGWIPYNAVVFVGDRQFNLEIVRDDPFLLWREMERNLLNIWPSQ